MIVLPAIDLRGGQCVRLLQGEPEEETVYCDDPVSLAQRWQAAGAEWLHVVNLDGAFAGALDTAHGTGKLPINLRRFREIVRMTSIPIEFGGGLRTLDDVQMILDLGAARVILGTVAVQRPDLVSEAVARFGTERVAIGLDARDGLIATHGWQQSSHVTAIDLGREMQQRGVRCVIYTDILRDGMLGGVNVSATASLAMQTGLRVIASGGVASVDDIHALRQVENMGVAGVVIGKALYTGAIQLEQALEAASCPLVEI
jgi:phosphoribosylformimino-5-aminoimidazole carboxamide ribotide isomerase